MRFGGGIYTVSAPAAPTNNVALRAGSFTNTSNGSPTNATCTISLGTCNSGDLVLLYTLTNGAIPTSVTSAHLTFTQLVNQGALTINYAVAGSGLSSEVITLVANGTPGYYEGSVFALSGVNASPFDAGGPQQNSSGNISITTANALDMVIAGFSFAGGAPTITSGYAQIGTGSFLCIEEKTYTATGTYTVTDVGTQNAAGIIGVKSS